jgi:hypothetical protein
LGHHPALASVALASKVTSERGEFRRDSHHAADNDYGRWPDTFVH